MSLQGFPPILDANARILILGSFPSEASLAGAHYYAHRQNQFWRILGAVLQQPLAEYDYPAKQAALKEAGIGVWDVYATCRREGSLDAAIRAPELNDFSLLGQWAPQLQRVLFNGGTAGKQAKHLAVLGYETRILPSTSPAHAGRSFEEKLALWREALTL